MTLEEFAKTNPSEEQINQLSEADRHDFENADITYSVTYNEPLTTNEGEQAQSDQFMNEDAGPKKCQPRRFEMCSAYRIRSIHYQRVNFKLRIKGERTIELSVKNLMDERGPIVTAIPSVTLIKETPKLGDETFTFTLTDQDRESMSAKFTVRSERLKDEPRVYPGPQTITVPVPFKVEDQKVITQGATSSSLIDGSITPSDPTFHGDGGKMRCSKESNSSSITNCVNPEQLPVLVFDGNKGFEHIAANIHTAIVVDKKTAFLTRDDTQARRHRYESCTKNSEEKLGKKPKPTEMKNASCDEYPFAGTREGGGDATVRWVPRSENSKQGGTIISFFRQNQVQPNEQFIVEAVLKDA